jgi:hypothetical protein
MPLSSFLQASVSVPNIQHILQSFSAFLLLLQLGLETAHQIRVNQVFFFLHQISQ